MDVLSELDPRKSRRSFEGLDINSFLDLDESSTGNCIINCCIILLPFHCLPLPNSTLT